MSIPAGARIPLRNAEGEWIGDRPATEFGARILHDGPPSSGVPGLLKFGGSPSSGTIQFQIGGETTAQIPFDATTREIATAIMLLSTVELASAGAVPGVTDPDLSLPEQGVAIIAFAPGTDLTGAAIIDNTVGGISGAFLQGVVPDPPAEGLELGDALLDITNDAEWRVSDTTGLFGIPLVAWTRAWARQTNNSKMVASSPDSGNILSGASALMLWDNVGGASESAGDDIQISDDQHDFRYQDGQLNQEPGVYSVVVTVRVEVVDQTKTLSRLSIELTGAANGLHEEFNLATFKAQRILSWTGTVQPATGQQFRVIATTSDASPWRVKFATAQLTRIA